MAVTGAVFAGIFGLMLLSAIAQVGRTSPMELLKAESQGEREPKARWAMALLGLALLGAGYAISLTVQDVLDAVGLFFVAVLMVIGGTYLVFTAGVVAMLKLMRRNKRYYYKARHFITVSGMMYRMKQNAVGLASICVLSTMVLVMLSSTGSLMASVDGMVEARYPYDIAMNRGDGDSADTLAREAAETAEEMGQAVTDELRYTYVSVSALQQGEEMVTDASFVADGRACGLYFITEADYEAMTGRSIDLAADEILIAGTKGDYQGQTLTIGGMTYTVREREAFFLQNGSAVAYIGEVWCIVVADETQLERLSGLDGAGQYTFWGADLTGSEEEKLEIYLAIDTQDVGYVVECRAWERDGAYSLYGGLFFLGAFLSALFTIAAILLIYYKQVSEGFADRRRFEIMVRVGMSQGEVKRAIRAQVLTVFFLPLGLAGVHTAFAMPIILKLLQMLFLSDQSVYIITALVCFGVFAAVYTAVYALTARTYYRIVSP